jgi:hypothetical protein
VHAVTARSRWVWGLSGLATAAVLAVPGARLLTSPGLHIQAGQNAAVTRHFAASVPITSLDVQSPGGLVQIRTGSGPGVRVTELISYDKPAGVPAVQNSVSRGRLTLADPACDTSDCSVSFTVTVPSAMFATVTTEGGPVMISGMAGADVDSGGAPVTLSHISGTLTVGTDGGMLRLDGLTGTFHADTAGGPLSAAGIRGLATISTDGGALNVKGLTGSLQADSGGGPATLTGVSAPTAIITTGGGSGRVVFATAPKLVTLSTDGGPAALGVPGGPYALNADSDSGPESVRGVTADPSAARSITVTSGGGSLTVGPAGAGH